MAHPIPSHEVLKNLLAQAIAGKAPGDLSWLGALIDHTLLKPEANRADVEKLCQEAMQNGFGAVCVRLPFVAVCKEQLKGSTVKVAAVVGFPTGLECTEEKVQETTAAISAGAQEIDMVMQVALLKEGKLDMVFRDIEAVVKAAGGAPVKVILETCLLDQEEKIIACGLAKAAGAAFLKTSTGFSSGGATLEDVALLRRVARNDMGVKASGGVRSLETALQMVLAGADRIGTSSGVAILGGSGNPASAGVY